MKNNGTLFVCPTPIGNLDDITIRVLNTLKSVDVIAAEDTRHTIKLLNHFNIKKPLTSYHQHNEREKGKMLIDKLLHGTNIALVSDAGMPGISDPGATLIKMAIDNNIHIDVLPGPTAFVLSLLLSGFSTDKFVFEGFLPSKKKERKKRLSEIKFETRTIIMYESPHRLIQSLKDMNEVLNNRDIAITRELTKKYQEIFRGSIKRALEKFSNETIRGEFVIVIQGISQDELDVLEEKPWDNISIKEHLNLYIENGLTKKEAVKKVTKERGLSKREVYKISIEL